MSNIKRYRFSGEKNDIGFQKDNLSWIAVRVHLKRGPLVILPSKFVTDDITQNPEQHLIPAKLTKIWRDPVHFLLNTADQKVFPKIQIIFEMFFVNLMVL